MTREQLLELKEKLSKLTIEEQKLRDVELMHLAKGEVDNPTDEYPVGYPSIDKPWLKNYTEEAILRDLPKQTLYEHVLERNKGNLNSIAINYFGKKVTYKDFFKHVDDVARSFTALGIGKGDVVSFCMATTPETIYSIYALNKIGAIANMIDLSTNPDFIVERINSTNSKCLIMLDTLDEQLKSVYDRLQVNKIIQVSPTNSLPVVDMLRKAKEHRLFSKVEETEKKISWKSFTENKSEKCNQVKYEEGMPALIVYTGGTTGVPKGAILSNDGINATISQLKDTGIHSDVGDRYLDIMPPFIAYGVVCGIHNPLSERQEIVVIPKLDPVKFPTYIRKYRINHAIGVPALFETMIKSGELQNENLCYLKNLICGGDKLTISSEKEINQFLKRHGSKARVRQGFGMTEVGTSVTYTINDESESLANHIGCPLSKTIIKIVNPGTEEELPYNEQGEICIFTPSKMIGYFKNEEETAKTVKLHSDGRYWIHSQDSGYIDKDGELFFIDRMKRMLVRHDGHNVWPGVIEQIISSHYAVDNCVVIGIQTEENTNGVIPTAVVVLKEEYRDVSDKMIGEIDELCRRTLPGRDIAQEYIVRDSIPKTTIGKVDYGRVEAEEQEYARRRKKSI